MLRHWHPFVKVKRETALCIRNMGLSEEYQRSYTAMMLTKDEKDLAFHLTIKPNKITSCKLFLGVLFSCSNIYPAKSGFL